MERVQYVDKNIELKFVERGCSLGFACRALGIGAFDVRVFEDGKDKKHEIAHLSGGDERVPMPTVLSNTDNLPEELLADMYHMARCRREMKRVGTDGPHYEGYEKGYKYHRERFLKNWKQHLKAEESRLVEH
ncbi:MAG TPA: hypothetical protein VGL38_11595 [bacterium]|jgi:hypothetical protein